MKFRLSRPRGTPISGAWPFSGICSQSSVLGFERFLEPAFERGHELAARALGQRRNFARGLQHGHRSTVALLEFGQPVVCAVALPSLPRNAMSGEKLLRMTVSFDGCVLLLRARAPWRRPSRRCHRSNVVLPLALTEADDWLDALSASCRASSVPHRQCLPASLEGGRRPCRQGRMLCCPTTPCRHLVAIQPRKFPYGRWASFLFP